MPFNIARIVSLFIAVTPFLLILFKDLNLFQNDVFNAIYILNLILLSINSLTSFNVEIPLIKASGDNTGAGIEVSKDLSKHHYTIKTHGTAGNDKIEEVISYIRKDKKEKVGA